MKSRSKEKCKYCHKPIRWTIDEYATDTVYPKEGLGISEYYHVECEKKHQELLAHQQHFDYHGRD